jgi:uncharacterized membrane protein YphA (DoxX/SURF4 family)
MSISSSAHKQKRVATTPSEESAITPPITLSERSSTGLALLRILVGYLWFQQLFWKLPPTFAGLYSYVVRESQHAILPGYGALLQHTFLAGCSSLSSPAGCTAFVPLAACVWTAELLVAISLLFGLFTRFGALLATVLPVQLYVGLAYTSGSGRMACRCFWRSSWWPFRQGAGSGSIPGWRRASRQQGSTSASRAS